MKSFIFEYTLESGERHLIQVMSEEVDGATKQAYALINALENGATFSLELPDIYTWDDVE